MAEESGCLKRIIERLERIGNPYTAETVATLFHDAREHGDGFIAFTTALIKQLEQIGKIRTAATYMTVLNSFVRFRQEREILLESVDAQVMLAYENYLKSNGICPNTTSFYMRNLRAIYNRAVDQDLIVQRYPFKHVYTGSGKTVKRAVPLSVIRDIRDIDLDEDPTTDYARDLFLFSFYTRGMSFIDMAYLKKRNLQNGILSYRRQKTNQQLFIKWETPMEEIVGKYDTNGSPYLLPIIRYAEEDERKQYKSAAHLVNVKLKKLGERLGLSMPLTTYVARHAWASIAKSKNVSLSVISEALGHDSEHTTRIYLASLDTSVVDKANNLVLRSL